jgi:hypothetical protein
MIYPGPATDDNQDCLTMEEEGGFIQVRITRHASLILTRNYDDRETARRRPRRPVPKEKRGASWPLRPGN